MKYHINNNDEVKKCVAQPGNCKFGEDAEHYPTVREAETALTDKLSEEYGSLPKTLTKNDNGNSVDMTSADISRAYAHLSVIQKHLHNSRSVGNDLELYYYSSPAGRIELERRKKAMGTDTGNVYSEIEEKIDSPDFSADHTIAQIDEEAIAARTRIGVELLSNTTLEENHEVLRNAKSEGREDLEHRKDHIGHVLINESHKWYSHLSTEEQVAIGELTSSGFKKLQYGLGIKDDQYSPHFIFQNDIDEDEIYDNYDDPEKQIEAERDRIGKEFVSLVNSAFKSAPRLQTPLPTYRGTTLDEVREILQLDENIEDEKVIEDLVNKKYDGVQASDESRLQKLPVSTSVLPEIALRFGEDAYLEIIRSTSTSPVSNSAWGTKEQEMLTNPLSDYKVIEAKTFTDDHDREVLIIQLEEVPRN